MLHPVDVYGARAPDDPLLELIYRATFPVDLVRADYLIHVSLRTKAFLGSFGNLAASDPRPDRFRWRGSEKPIPSLWFFSRLCQFACLRKVLFGRVICED